MKKFLIGTSILLGLGLIFAFWPGNNTLPEIQEGSVLEFYYGHSCPHCHDEIEWLPKLQNMYPDLKIQKFEVWNNTQNKKLWNKRMTELGQEVQGVPTNIIQDQVIVGFKKEAIVEAVQNILGSPKLEKPLTEAEQQDICTTAEVGDALDCEVPQKADWWEKYLKYYWPIMAFVLGIVDGFNPCAMWSLLILLGFLLPMQDKRRRWWIGGIFIGASFVIYFGALFTYLLGFESISKLIAMSIMQWVFRLVGVMALVAGAFALWEARKKEIDCKVQNADQKRKFASKLEAILSREKFILVLLGVTGLAFSVNAVELLCSIAIPTAFTGQLVSLDLAFWKQITAITIYDIAYILDDIIVFTIAMWTMSLKILSARLVQISHFIGGVLLIVIGLLMMFKPEFLSI